MHARTHACMHTRMHARTHAYYIQGLRPPLCRATARPLCPPSPPRPPRSPLARPTRPLAPPPLYISPSPGLIGGGEGGLEHTGGEGRPSREGPPGCSRRAHARRATGGVGGFQRGGRRLLCSDGATHRGCPRRRPETAASVGFTPTLLGDEPLAVERTYSIARSTASCSAPSSIGISPTLAAVYGLLLRRGQPRPVAPSEHGSRRPPV